MPRSKCRAQRPRRDDGAQLKETTWTQGKRMLLKVMAGGKDTKATAKSVENLMGAKAETASRLSRRRRIRRR